MTGINTSDSESFSSSTKSDTYLGAAQPILDVFYSFWEAGSEFFGMTLKYIFWAAFIAVPAFWASCAVYYAFYYMVIPQGKFIDPVDFDFTVNPPTDTFFIQRPKWQSCLGATEDMARVLKTGERYDVMLRMTVPTSPEFLSLEKTVMVHLRLKSCEGETVAQAARGFVPRYYNSWSHLLYRSWIFIPSAIGMWSESTTIWLPLMKDFVESESNHTCMVEITISEPTIHIYKAELAFSLLLTGTRRIFRDWFVSSSLVGVLSIFFTMMAGIAMLLIIMNSDAEEDTTTAPALNGGLENQGEPAGGLLPDQPAEQLLPDQKVHDS